MKQITSFLWEKLTNLISKINPFVWLSAVAGIVAYLANRRANNAENALATEQATNVAVKEKTILEIKQGENNEAQTNLNNFVTDFTRKHGHKPGE